MNRALLRLRVALFLYPVAIALFLISMSPSIRAGVDTWDGAYSTSWDTATPNWNWDGGANNTKYASGDGALFCDYANGLGGTGGPGSWNITISGTGVSPASITVTSTTGRAWTIGGGGVIAGSGTLGLLGNASLTMIGFNTFNGGTTLSSGSSILNINSTGAGSGATGSSPIGTGALTISGSGTVINNTSGGAVVVNTNNAQSWNADFTFGGSNALNLGAGAVTMGSNRTVTVLGTAPLIVGGIIGGSGFSLTKSGSGTLVLNGANTFSGGTVLNGGNLALGNAAAIGTGALTLAAGTLLDNVSTHLVTFANTITQNWNGSFGFGLANNTGDMNMGTGAVAMNTSPTIAVNGIPGKTILTVGGIITGGANSLTKAGNGILVLSAANNYTGGTFVNAGQLNINNAAAIGSGTLSINGAIDNTSAALITLSNNNPQTWNGAFTFLGSNALNLGTGAVTVASNTTLTSKGGAGLLTIGGNVNGSNPNTALTINPYGSITLSGTIGSNIGNVTVGAGTGTVNLGGSNNFFTGNLAVGTGATVVLTGSNTMSGITLNGGVIKVNAGAASYAVNGVFGTGPLTINGGGVDFSIGNGFPTGLTLTLASQTWNNNFVINANNANNNSMGNGAITLGGNVTVGVNNNSTTTFGGNIGDGGLGYGLSFTSSYGGNAVLAGNNTYTGPTNLIGYNASCSFTLMGSNSTSAINVINAGLILGNATTSASSNVLGTGPLTLTWGSNLYNAYATGTLTLTTNNPQVWAGDFIFGNGRNATYPINFGPVSVTLTGNRTVYDAASGVAPYTIGGISDGGNNFSLTLDGNAQLHLTRASTYSGGTTLIGGLTAYNNGQPNLSLDFNAAGAPTTNLLRGTSALTLDGAYLALNGATTGTSSQTLGSFTLNNYNKIVLTPGAAANTTQLTLPNNWTRLYGGVLYADLSASGTTALNSQPIASITTSNSSSSILPYVIVKDSTTTGFGIVVNNNIVRYTSALTLAAGTGVAPTLNYDYNNSATLTLGGPTSVKSLSLRASATALNLGGNTLTINSGGLLNLQATTLSNGTITAGVGTELVLSSFGVLTGSNNLNIDSNAAFTTAGTAAVNLAGNITNTPVLNFNTTGGTTVTGTITGVNTLNLGYKSTKDTIGVLGTAGTPLGSSLTINNQNIAANGPVFNGLLTGNGSTVLNININTAYNTNYSGETMVFSGGMTGIGTINYVSGQNILINLLLDSLQINGATPVTGLSAVNLSNFATSNTIATGNTISAPLVLGSSFSVTETNAGFLLISGGITGNGSTAISFRGPQSYSGGINTANANTIETLAIGDGTAAHAVASFSNDGISPLIISSNINGSTTTNLTLNDTSWGQLKVSGTINANNLYITGGNGNRAPWLGGFGIAQYHDMVDLAAGANNAISGNTSVTDATLFLDYSAAGTNFTKINPAGSLTLSSASLIVSNAVNATPAVASTVIGSGQSVVDLNLGTGSLTLGALSNINLGTVNIFTQSPGAGSAVKITGGTVGNLIGGWATIGTDFAAIGTGGIVTAPGANGVVGYYALGTGTAVNLSGSNVQDSVSSGAQVIMTGAIAANSFQYLNGVNNVTLNPTLNLQGNNMSLTSGGLLFDTTAGAGSANITGTGTIYGDATNTGNSPLYVTVDPMTTGNVVHPSMLAISDSVVGNGTGTLVKTGFGELIVTASAGYSGGTVINGGMLRADGNALSAGPLKLNSAGAYATSGSFTRVIGTAAGQVSFGPGGGGFSAEGGNLVVNLGGNSTPSSVNASQLGGNLVVGSHVYSTGVLNFQNPIVMDEPFSVTTSAFPDGSYIGNQSNLGSAYTLLSGGITGAGGLSILASGYHAGNAAGNTNMVPSGMIAVTGGLNVTGPILVSGASLYVPSMASLANNNVSLVLGGVIATNGTANVIFGPGNGQVAFLGAAAGTTGNGGGGFAAVGGNLVVIGNNNIPSTLRNDGGLNYTPLMLVLGNAFSTNAVDYQSPLDLNASNLTINSNGPVPNIMSGMIIGGNSAQSFTVAGDGVLLVTNPNNNYAGSITVNAGAELKAGSPAALGNPNAGTGVTINGTLDLNGYSFSGRNWVNFAGPSSISGVITNVPALINTNTLVSSTFGAASDLYYINGNGGGTNYAVGGPGNITLPGSFVGTVTNNTSVNFRGTGTVTMTGDATQVVYGAGTATTLDRGTNENVLGMTLVLDYSTDTLSKILIGFSPGSTSFVPRFGLNSGNLQLKGNASSAVTENLPIIGPTYLSGPGVAAASVNQVGLLLTGGLNTVKLTTAGAQNLTLNVGSLIVTNGGAVDFSTNTSAGGTAAINFGTSGLNIALTGTGAGYPVSQTGLPIFISAPNTAGGVQATGHAVTNSSGVVTAVYIDNWGSGYTGNPTITIPGGTTAATASLYFNNPLSGILGGFATYGGTDWAYRDSNGNIQPLPSGSYASDPGSTWAVNTNVSLDAAGLASGMSASQTVGSLRITGSGTLNITSGQTLYIGNNTTNITQYGGILETSAVGAGNVTITGGNLQNASAYFNTPFYIHQNNTAGTLTIGSVIPSNGNQYLVKDGPGTLILTNAANAFYGLLINGGTLEVPTLANTGIASPSGVGGGAIGSGQNSLLVQGGGTYRVNASSPQSTNAILTVGIGGGSLDASGAGTVTFIGQTAKLGSDNYQVAVSGDGVSNFTLTGSGNGVMTGGIYLMTPPQSVGSFGNSGASGVVEGFTQVTKAGSGTWTLNAYNYWQGGTIINQGTLVLNNNPANNYLVGPATGATVSGTFVTGNNVSFTTTQAAGTQVIFTAGNVPAGLSLNTPYYVLTTGLTTALSLTSGGSPVTFTGGSVIGNGVVAGINVLANSAYGNAISDNAPVEIDAGGTLQLNYPEVTGAVRLYGGSITGAGTLNGRSYDFQSGSVSNNMTGDFSALTKTTAGTVTVSGINNDYKGATTVTGGTLIVSGSLSATPSVSIGTGAIMQVDGVVNSAATVTVAGILKGTGSVGAVSVQNGGTLAPGHSPGVLTVTNGLAFSGPGASLSIIINSTTAGTGYSQVNVTGGTVNLNGATLNLTLNYTPALAVVNADGSAFSSLGDTFYLVLGNSSINGQFAGTQGPSFSGGLNTITIGGQEFAINYQSDGGPINDNGIGNQIALMAIPEPQTWVMLISGIGMLNLLRRRRS